jgi:KDO2-lipid IV(A) lauroyltransferase
VTFLGVDTAFIPGVEVVSRKLDCPVVYAAMRRVSPGYYTIRYKLMAEHPSALPEEEITKRYAHMIETDILEDPGSWLWTHKRWKKRRPPVRNEAAVS